MGQAGVRIPAAAQLFLNTSNFFFYFKFLRLGLGLRWGSGIIYNYLRFQKAKSKFHQILRLGNEINEVLDHLGSVRPSTESKFAPATRLICYIKSKKSENNLSQFRNLI